MIKAKNLATNLNEYQKKAFSHNTNRLNILLNDNILDIYWLPVIGETLDIVILLKEECEYNTVELMQLCDSADYRLPDVELYVYIGELEDQNDEYLPISIVKGILNNEE